MQSKLNCTNTHRFGTGLPDAPSNVHYMSDGSVCLQHTAHTWGLCIRQLFVKLWIELRHAHTLEAPPAHDSD